MAAFLRWLAALLFERSRIDTSSRRTSETEADDLRGKILKWERQAAEYEKLGLEELARRSRETLREYRRRLQWLETSPRHRAA